MKTNKRTRARILSGYGLDRLPFGKEFQADEVYHTDDFDRALDALRYLVDRRGLGTLIAPPGVGKTVLLRIFLSELSEQLMQDLGERDGELPEMNSADQLINSEDLQSLIEAARELARTGQMEAAREMLAQLRELLENLRANPFAQQMDDANRQAMQMMQEMERMIGEQQDLLDRSFDRGSNFLRHYHQRRTRGCDQQPVLCCRLLDVRRGQCR